MSTTKQQSRTPPLRSKSGGIGPRHGTATHGPASGPRTPRSSSGECPGLRTTRSPRTRVRRHAPLGFGQIRPVVGVICPKRRGSGVGLPGHIGLEVVGDLKLRAPHRVQSSEIGDQQV